MKSVVYSISKNKINKALCKAENVLLSFLNGKNIDITNVISTDDNEERVLTNLEFLSEGNDNIFILCDKTSYINLKNTLLKLVLTDLAESEFAKNSITEYAEKKAIRLSKKDEQNYMLPRGSRAIKNLLSTYLGYILVHKQTEIIVLPNDEEEVLSMLPISLTNYVDSKSTKIYYTKTFRTFGLDEVSVTARLASLLKSKIKIQITILTDELCGEVILRYKGDTSKIELDTVIAEVLNKLKGYVYTDQDLSIFDYATQLLEIRKKRVSIIESISNGGVISAFMRGKNARNFMQEGLVLNSPEVIEENLGIAEGFLATKSDSDIAYEFSAALLEYDIDGIVLSCYGKFRDENHLEASVAVGDAESILVFNFADSGKMDEMMVRFCQNAIYCLIKKLKDN